MIKLIRSVICNSRKKAIRVLFPSFFGKKVFLGHNTFIGRYCHLSKTKIGRYTYICNGCTFSNSLIGSFCSISNNVRVISGTHPTTKWISTHPLFFSKNCYVGKGFINENRFEEFKKTNDGYSCEIGNDVWIGTDVIILQGIKVGDGAIIGAGSLVTTDVPPYSIVTGIPARIIKYRFNDEEIKFLNELKWWEWSDKQIEKMARYFNDINQLRIHL